MVRPRRAARKQVDAMQWIFRTGAPWRDLPEYYGPWKTVYNNFQRWRDAGVWENILRNLNPDPDPPWQLMAAHGRFDQRKSASAQCWCKKKGADNDQAIGRSRGGLTTKVHAVVDEKGRPIRLLLSKGNLNDITLAPQFVDGLALAQCYFLTLGTRLKKDHQKLKAPVPTTKRSNKTTNKISSPNAKTVSTFCKRIAKLLMNRLLRR